MDRERDGRFDDRPSALLATESDVDLEWLVEVLVDGLGADGQGVGVDLRIFGLRPIQQLPRFLGGSGADRDPGPGLRRDFLIRRPCQSELPIGSLRETPAGNCREYLCGAIAA